MRHECPLTSDTASFDSRIGDDLYLASKNGQWHVQAYGQMLALLCANDKTDAAIEFEEMWSRIRGRYSVSLLCGYEMHAFSDNGNSEVVILDIRRPAMNGYQMVERLRNEMGMTSALLLVVTVCAGT